MDSFFDFIAGRATLIAFLTMLGGLVAFIMTIRELRRVLAKQRERAEREETLGEDVPPEFPGTMRPKSLPNDFGKSPGRK